MARKKSQTPKGTPASKTPKSRVARRVKSPDARSVMDGARLEKRLLPRPGQVIVRMYRQGLGDCFLLAFGSKSARGPRYVLIDCGVHARQTDGSQRLLQVMRNIAAATGNKLHVVAATHEHADHLSGFVQKGSPFLAGKVEIDELWVAWTEKVGDEQADRLRRKFGCARKVIEKAIEQAQRRAQANQQMTNLAIEIAGLNDFEHPAKDSVDEDAVRERLESLTSTPEQAALLKSLSRRFSPASSGEVAAAKTKRTKPSSNELALALLTLTAKQVTYCEPKRKSPLTLSGVPELRAYVLGPPRDESLLEQDKPTRIRGATDEHGEPKHKEVYLTPHASTRALQVAPVLGAASEIGEDKDFPDDLRFPFKSTYRRLFKQQAGQFKWDDDKNVPLRTRKIIEQNYLNLAHSLERPAENAGPAGNAVDSPIIDQSWRRVDGDWLGSFGQLALDLDGDTNNTSLVLAFELGKPGVGPVLLFPGDAQVGNWLSWRDQSYQAGDKKVTTDDLLRRTVLYKVGHHGSHNATVKCDPRETTSSHTQGVPFGLELMDSIIAMIPVDRDAASKKMPRPWKMPHLPLYQRLRDKAQRRVLRSDQSLLPLDEDEVDPDLKPGSPKWSSVPGMRNAKWRQAEEQFTTGTPGPLYYEVLFELDED